MDMRLFFSWVQILPYKNFPYTCDYKYWEPPPEWWHLMGKKGILSPGFFQKIPPPFFPKGKKLWPWEKIFPPKIPQKKRGETPFFLGVKKTKFLEIFFFYPPQKNLLQKKKKKKNFLPPREGKKKRCKNPPPPKKRGGGGFFFKKKHPPPFFFFF